MQELKDLSIIEVRHFPGDENDVDIFTKNVTRAIFEKHLPQFVDKDEYMVK